MLAPYAKAVIAALLAGLASLQTAMLEDGRVSNNEWIIVAIAVVSALGLVWGVPNTPKETKPQEGKVEQLPASPASAYSPHEGQTCQRPAPSGPLG